MIRKVLAVTAAAGMAVSVTGCTNFALTKPTPSPSGTATPTEVLAVKVVGDQLTYVCTEAPASQICPAMQKLDNGAWNMEAASRVLKVHTNISRNQFGSTFAQNACVLFADWVRDPSTQKPLDMIGVEVWAQDIQLANCKLPKE